ncbi:hypothetical protein T5B8_09064 [Salinisphaera sp. T5B8]|uniref:hypothetical protein n=1 Tax=Salinisphaera sp. T5B8 TaxID=1304154 RepID=UPI0033414CB5
MARLLGLLLLVGLGWLIVRQLLGARRPSRDTSATPRFEKTVRCSRCGVHLPLALSTRDANGAPICNDSDCDKRAFRNDPDH